MKETKKQIVNKAIELFKAEHYENVSIDRICQECGVTKGSFYHYFNSKSDVFAEYFYLNLHQRDDILESVLTKSTRIEQIWALIEPGIDYGISMGAETLKYFWINDIQNGGKTLTPFFAEIPKNKSFSSVILTLIDTAQKNGEIRSDITPMELYDDYLSAFMGISVNWAASGGSYDVKEKMQGAFLRIFRK